MLTHPDQCFRDAVDRHAHSLDATRPVRHASRLGWPPRLLLRRPLARRVASLPRL